ncbi:MAG: hypothetical protein HYV34_04125 [Candidatus Kerfeldbacteria bacterium]|nr:hypothetical protein [Candidatus Kerfeldbacteria bacterium]
MVDSTVVLIVLVCVALLGLIIVMFEIPVIEGLDMMEWGIRRKIRSLPKKLRFRFSSEVELRCSATVYDEPHDRETFNSLLVSFGLSKAGKEQGVRLCGGGSLFDTIWRYESILAGPMPGVLVKSGGFVIVEGEGCGQFLVLINKAYSPRKVEIEAHQILVPEDGEKEEYEKPLPDGRVVRVLRFTGQDAPSLEIFDLPSFAPWCAPTDSPTEMGKFHRALAYPASRENTANAASTSTSPN